MSRLVSSKKCPFVQRAVSRLVAHGVAHIDLANEPDGVLEPSPRGKVRTRIAFDTGLGAA
jgi:hypothetical protein